MLKITRVVIKGFAYLLLFLVSLLLIHYLMCPVYTFSDPRPFYGTNLYNPYQDIDSMVWRKGNFQVQAKAWGGITDGRKNSSEMIFDVYRQLDYDIITISDYQKINTFGADSPAYIPVYEHGYGIEKNHHVVVGAQRVVWFDYPLFQNLHHKQHILNKLRSSSELVYIAHPNFTKGYHPEEMKWLSDYDGIEVLNGFRKSVEHWDTALSAGHYVTILANDDAHDVSNPDEIGQFCMFIHAPQGSGSEAVMAMKHGQAFGAEIPRPLGESMETKALRHQKLPQLKKVIMMQDTLVIELDSVASEIRFIGQGGSVLSRTSNTVLARYTVQHEDTYVRSEISYPDGTTYYLNPVARYQDTVPANPPAFAINKRKTWLIRGLTFTGLIVVWFFYRRRKFNQAKPYE